MLGNILGILGIAFTVLFGIYSIWTYRKSKRKVSIELKNEQCYSLFKDDVTRLNIELIYNKKVITNALILFKARIVNNGQVDIDKNRVFKPLKIISQNDFSWLEARLTYQPSGSTTSISLLNSNEIQIEWDLLKSTEYIEFEALIEINTSLESDDNKTSTFYNGLSFDFRITDLNNIQKENKNRPKNLANFVFKNTYYFSAVVIIFGALFLINEYIPSFRFLPDNKIVVMNIDNGKKQIKGYFDTQGDETLTICSVEDKSKTNISIAEFNKTNKITAIEKTIVSRKNILLNKIIGFLYIGMGLLLISLRAWVAVSLKKRKKKMSSH